MNLVLIILVLIIIEAIEGKISMKIEKNKWKKNLFSVLNDNFINFRIFDALYFTMFMNRTFILKKKRYRLL